MRGRLGMMRRRPRESPTARPLRAKIRAVDLSSTIRLVEEKLKQPGVDMRVFGLGQSEMYLIRALDEFHRAGNAPDLWMPVDDFHFDTIFKGAQEVLTAKNRRLQFLRTSMLFSAIAAEAFANEFVDDTLGRNMAGTLDKLSTVDKLIVGAQLVAGNASPLDKGRQPMQDIAGLATTRDRLVHPKEKGGIAAWTQHVTQDDENRVGAAAAERAILAVVDLVVVCNPLQKHPNLHGGAAKRISMERKLLSAHGKKVGTLLGDLPSKEEAGTLPLFTQMENAWFSRLPKQAEASSEAAPESDTGSN
jgi:hypothetical protein